MGDVVSCQEGGDKMSDGTRLSTVGTEQEGVQSSLPVERSIVTLCTTTLNETNGQGLLAEVVENHYVGIHVEQIIGVGRIVICGPCLRLRALVREHVVAVFRFVIHAVKSCHLQENRFISAHLQT